MTLQTPRHVPSNEPSIVVNIIQTEVEPETNQSPYPSQLPLKPHISEALFKSGGHCGKRKRTQASVVEIATGCCCIPRPAYYADMPEPWSRKNSTYSTLPTTPPTPGVVEAAQIPPHSRRPSQVAELVEKTIARLKHIFGSRRRSTEDEAVSSNAENTRHSSLSHDPETQEEQAWRGIAHLPNVSQYFNTHGEAGPSRFYATADWDTFQATLNAREPCTLARLKSDVHYEGDMDQDEPHQSAKRKRKDSQFSLGVFLKPRRFSKVDKGKGPMVYDDTAPTSTRESLLPGPSEMAATPLGDVGIFLRSTADRNSLPISFNVPKAEFSDTKPSRWSTKSVGAKQLQDDLLHSPWCFGPVAGMITPKHSYEDVVSPIGSNDSFTSFSSINYATAGRGQFQNLRLLSQSPTATERPAHAEGHGQLMYDDLIGGSSSSLSSTSLRHGDRPDTAPSSPCLRPTSIRSLEAMQKLTLGPPSQAMLSPSHSSERIFRLSAEHLDAPARPAPLGPSSLARTTLAGDNGEDEIHFSTTHPAPPSPALDHIPTVRRRQGILQSSENLRSIYIEQGDGGGQMSTKMALKKGGKGRLSPKKSLQDQCWWSEDETGASPPRQYL